MRKAVLTRFTIFFIAVIVSVIYLLPTFVPNLPSWWHSVFPGEPIRLGLDLQGGSHLVLDVKVDKAIENNMERMKLDLVNQLREKGIGGVTGS